WAQQIDHGTDAGRDAASRLLDEATHDRLAFLSVFRDLRTLESGRVDAFPLLAHMLGGVVDQLLGPVHQVPSAGDRFQSGPMFPADDDVANLARMAVEAVVELAVENQPTADAGAGEYAEDMVRTLGSPVTPLTVGSHAHVVFDDHWPRPVFGKQ